MNTHYFNRHNIEVTCLDCNGRGDDDCAGGCGGTGRVFVPLAAAADGAFHPTREGLEALAGHEVTR